jgi:hypothetical protein
MRLIAISMLALILLAPVVYADRLSAASDQAPPVRPAQSPSHTLRATYRRRKRGRHPRPGTPRTQTPADTPAQPAAHLPMPVLCPEDKPCPPNSPAKRPPLQTPPLKGKPKRDNP